MTCKAQDKIANKSTSTNTTAVNKPKLVVGIVIDQMRYDYLTRFYSKYGEAGFKRLIKNGYTCKNNHYNYIPTFTGPGHASIFSGTTPRYHGIISNNWYDKFSKESVYCVEDTTVNSIGTTSIAGQMSPHRLQGTTIADQNRMFTQMRGKSIGISIKDRGAILPAGHTANAAYWFQGEEEGKWISSSFYMEALPKWVTTFNAAKKVDAYLTTWDTYYPISSYTESGSDLNDFERGFKNKTTATFPYNLKELAPSNGNYSILKTTPFGNALTTDFAIAAIEGENLGQDIFTDILTISYSSTDYIGHNFGVNSKEIEDTYIRLDKELERLLHFLDTKVGVTNYTLFLTSDHGAVPVPAYLKTLKIPAGYYDSKGAKNFVNNLLKEKYGASNLVENISNGQIFLNRKTIETLQLKLEEVQNYLVENLINFDGVYKVIAASALQNAEFTTGVEALLQNGYHQKRSGDVMVILDPAVISYSKKGSTHGSGFTYDTHVPLLFYGKGIASGSTFKRTTIIDIAPTITALLDIGLPNTCFGNPLEFVFKK